MIQLPCMVAVATQHRLSPLNSDVCTAGWLQGHWGASLAGDAARSGRLEAGRPARADGGAVGACGRCGPVRRRRLAGGQQTVALCVERHLSGATLPWICSLHCAVFLRHAGRGRLCGSATTVAEASPGLSESLQESRTHDGNASVLAHNRMAATGQSSATTPE